MNRTQLPRAVAVLAAGLTVVLVAAACSSPSSVGAQSSGAVLSESEVAATVATLPEKSVAVPPAMRLAHGLVPPTNRWFSGLVFGERPQPVFPLPLSFGLSENGFGFGVPTVTTSANTITGGYAPSITVDAGAATSRITAYDDVSVTIAALNGAGKPLGSTVIAEGSPLVSFTAARSLSLGLGQNFRPAGDRLWSVTVGGSTYGLRTDGAVSKDGSRLSLRKGSTAVWFAVPRGGEVKTLAAHVAPLRSVSLAYSTEGQTVRTDLGYRTQGQKDTLIAALPHQRSSMDTSGCTLGSYPSVSGTMTLCSGTSLSWTAPAIAPADSLNIGKLDEQQRTELRSQVKQDVAMESALPADTYFGGKALYRLANLLTLATQLDDEASARTLRDRLGTALREWTQPTGCAKRSDRCFVYDAAIKGVVGQTASFGSDEFNDHHFHYGYFLYAAGVAAANDSALRRDIAPVMNLLAADIASSGGSKYFPDRRAFDPYAGHSWASGFAPFADGNNQESSSEAVSAWNGLALWAGVTKNAALTREAVWMLSSEAASANAYWTNFDSSDPVYGGYAHSVVSLNWGGKRDYSTWFSAEANAKLGILLIPMSPASGYLAGDPARIEKNLASAAPQGYDVQFGDYMLMYSALAGATQATTALQTARDLPQKFIDDANSRSYTLAWIMTR